MYDGQPIWYFIAPIGLSNADPTLPSSWLEGTVKVVPNGFTTILPSGRVFSLQPGGQYQDRDPGTAGAYEVWQPGKTLNVMQFSPNGMAYAIYVKQR